MKLIDISCPISPDSAVYPGDPKVKIDTLKTLRKDGFLLSRITMGLHTGTHIDAPSHYVPDGKSVDEIPLESLTGDAIVCDLSRLKRSITAGDLSKFEINAEDIVFLKTQDTKEHVFLEVDGADYLVKKKIKAVGIDCLSIDKYGSDAAHKKLLGNDIPIIEGLVLGHVRGGRYLTHCSPLKITGAEASPARCVLVEL